MTSRHPINSSESCPLAGVRVCLVFENSLSHYTRLLQEIKALQLAGALVSLVTSDTSGYAPPDVDATSVPLPELVGVTVEIPSSQFRVRPLRGFDDLVRRLIRAIAVRAKARSMIWNRNKVLRHMAEDVDVFWVIDFPSLPRVMSAVRRTSTKVVYETVDLVPEYQYLGDAYRLKSLDEERKLVAQVDGFITSSDSYADYYMERYGDKEIQRRPVVRDNMPDHVVTETKPTASPIKVLFLGSLMFDRPVMELIEAAAMTSSDISLTFQGKNLIGERPFALIETLGLQDKVSIIDPCPPESIVETAREYDFGVVALKGENENERRASTSKLFTYMSAGLAIIGSDLPGIARVVNEYRNGILVEGMEPTAWAEALDEAATLPGTEIDAMKRHSLDGAERHAWEKQRPEFIEEFLRALGLQKETS